MVLKSHQLNQFVPLLHVGSQDEEFSGSAREEL